MNATIPFAKAVDHWLMHFADALRWRGRGRG